MKTVYYRIATPEELETLERKQVRLCGYPEPATTPKHELEKIRDWWLKLAQEQPNSAVVDNWLASAASIQAIIDGGKHE